MVYKGEVVKLLYFKPSYDTRFVEFRKEEITSIRQWSSSITPVIVMVYNYIYNNYTLVDMQHITEKMWSTRREGATFLFNNVSFKWRGINESFSI